MNLQKNVLIKSQQILSLQFQYLTTLNKLVVNHSRSIISNYKDNLIQLNQVTINSSKSILYRNRTFLSNTTSQLVSKPQITLYNRINDIKNLKDNLEVFNSLYLKNQRSNLSHYVSLIKMMSPNNILKKGFAIVKVEGKITSSADSINIGQDIEIILSDTKIKSTVKLKSEYNGTDVNI